MYGVVVHIMDGSVHVVVGCVCDVVNTMVGVVGGSVND